MPTTKQIHAILPFLDRFTAEGFAAGTWHRNSDQTLWFEISDIVLEFQQALYNNGWIPSPAGFWYDQDQHEWVIVLKGAATLRFEDQTLEMKPGDFVNIVAHKKHRVEWTTPDETTIWLALHYSDVK